MIRLPVKLRNELLSRQITIILLLMAFAGLTLAISNPAFSADAVLQVNTFVDVNDGACEPEPDGNCSLREAIIAANAVQSPVTITLSSGTYLLAIPGGGEDDPAKGDLDISNDINIIGQGADETIVDGGGIDRIFDVLVGGSLTISNVTIRNGGANPQGGGIYSNGNLIVRDSRFESNLSNNGGAIFSQNSLVLENSTFEGNMANSGGGLYQMGGTVSILNSTFFNNMADSDGGAIMSAGGTLDVFNSTISGNQAQKTGGGLRAGTGTGPLVTIVNSTFANNESRNGGSVRVWRGEVSLLNTILAQSIGIGNCSVHNNGVLISDGHNLSDDLSCEPYFSEGNGDQLNVDPLLEPLADNGGNTETHALPEGSPAVDAGTCDAPTPKTDQRGVDRPQAGGCDIGSFEVTFSQTGPIFVVNTADDIDDGSCGFDHCSLREAIKAANNRTNDVGGVDGIHFNIPGTGQHVIQVQSPLPAVTDPLIIDGTTEPDGLIILDGSNAGAGADGLTIDTSNSRVQGLEITGFSAAGINIISGSGNSILSNQIYDNGSGIDLEPGSNNDQEAPTLTLSVVRVADATPSTDIGGILSGIPMATYTIELFGNPSCPGAQGEKFLTSTTLTTDDSGAGTFLASVEPALEVDAGVTATVTDPVGNTSIFSICKEAETLNDSWLTAKPIPLGAGSTTASGSQVIFQSNQTLWFRFPVTPRGQIEVTVNGLPGTVVTLHRDLFNEYDKIANPESAAVLSANSLPAGYLPAGYLPAGYLPAGYLPAGYLPAGYLPAGYLPAGYLPAGYLPAGYLPAGYLPAGYLPAGYLPGQSLPAGYLPAGYLPAGYLPELYSGAIRRSLIAITDEPAAVTQTIVRNTWDMSEDLYVQVAGPASLAQPYTVEVTFTGGQCDNVPLLSEPEPGQTIIAGAQPPAGTTETLIVWDSGRMVAAGSPQANVDVLSSKLNAFAGRSDINGQVIDLSATENGNPKYPRVVQANAIADQHFACVTAKNAVTEEIRRVIDIYRAQNSANGETTLKYIVLAGSDYEIPFCRYADDSGLANENEYIPPVDDFSASQASLRQGNVLGQDCYGAEVEVNRSGYSVPIPQLAVGRLVRTAEQISGLIDAYPANGIVTPGSALATGYDFVADAGDKVADEFFAGLNQSNCTGCLPVDELITPQEDGIVGAWTADQLRDKLLNQRYDLIFMAGHFTAGSLVAGDYQTNLLASEVLDAGVDFTNSIILGLGCHGGYNIPGPDASPFSPIPDFPEAFADRGATLIASTGYAYGDTELTEYGEKLYLNIARQMRSGTGPVAIGQALTAAKRDYLAQQATMEGLDDKTIIETTLFGLPMLRVDMPGQRFVANETPAVSGATQVTGGPGAALGLKIGQPASGSQPDLIQVKPTLTRQDVPLTNVVDNSTFTASYFTSANGEVVARAAEAIFPRERINLSLPGLSARSVGLYSGTYQDVKDIIPLTSASTTENSRAHPGFFSDSYYPSETAALNFSEAVDGGPTWLNTTPAQYRSNACDSIDGTMRTYSEMNFRLFYLDENWPQSPNPVLRAAALAASPDITGVLAQDLGNGQVQFGVNLVSDPAAAVQAVWITWTDPQAASLDGTNTWQSIDLVPNTLDPSLWEITANIPTSALFMVQAVNAAGSHSLVTNDGFFYSINPFGAPPPVAAVATTLQFLSSPSSGTYLRSSIFQVQLTSGGAPLGAGYQIILSVGGQRTCALTDVNGVATFNIQLSQSPGNYTAQASFRGSPTLASSLTGQIPFTIVRDKPTLTLEPAGSITFKTGKDSGVAAVLTDSAGRPLPEKSIFFVATDGAGDDTLLPVEVKTDLDGRVELGIVNLPAGTYTLKVYFSGNIPGVGQFDDFLYEEVSTQANMTILTNVLPVAEAGPDKNLAEGSSIQLDGSSSTDPDGTITAYEWDLDYDGSNFDVDATGLKPVFDATALDGDSIWTVALRVTDDDGATHVDTVVITVDNVAPTVGDIAVPDTAIPLSMSLNASAVFSDPGTLDSHTAEWDWGDNSFCNSDTDTDCEVTETAGSGTANGIHLYSEVGFKTITLKIRDDDGAVSQTVSLEVLVYEAGIGHVTGGGSVNIPDTACIAGQPYCNPNKAFSEANHGFVSQYQKGEVIPEGEINFSYKSGGLNFHSNSYDTLIAVGAWARFSGQGIVNTKTNGDETTFFEVTAIDGDFNIQDSYSEDRFGIRIWLANGSLIVDTALGNDDPFGTLRSDGGQITVHESG